MTATTDVDTIDGLIRWFLLTVLAVGAAAAGGGALFGLLAALFRVRDSALPLLGRLVGLLALGWALGGDSARQMQWLIDQWWRAELSSPSAARTLSNPPSSHTP